MIHAAGPRPQSVIAVCLERGIRAVLIIGAAALLAWAWGVDVVHLAGQDTRFARIAHSVFSAVVILLVADVLWHAMKSAIDNKLAETADPGLPNSDESRRRARLHTLLPIFRNVLFVFVIAVAALMALAAMGVEIGPLIAGASVVGVAIGFGAQTFVRDIIAGMFYLLDDAFRVGEYIQSNNYKGTVEGFSIRSVRLRHHRGPVYTVPFENWHARRRRDQPAFADPLCLALLLQPVPGLGIGEQRQKLMNLGVGEQRQQFIELWGRRHLLARPDLRRRCGPRDQGGPQDCRRNATPQRPHRCPSPFGQGDHRCYRASILPILGRHQNHPLPAVKSGGSSRAA